MERHQYKGARAMDATESASLDCKRADRSVWLVKVPAFVKAAWTAAAAAPTAATNPPQIGTVSLTFDPTADAGALPAASLRMHAAPGAPPLTIPADYELTFQPGAAPMMVFSSDTPPGGTKRVAVEGRVEYKLDAKPSNVEDAAYSELSKRRLEASTKKTRQVQILSDQKARRAIMRPLPVNSSGKGGRGAGSGHRTDERRARMEKEPLMDMLFKLFERQTLWNFKQLMAETNQPAVWLKEVLLDVCRYHKRGPNADKWEVKPEYKQSHIALPLPDAKRLKTEES